MDKTIPQVGKVVNFVMKDKTVRPLIVLVPWGGSTNMVNGHLLLDGGNDRLNDPQGDVPAEVVEAPLVRWAGSVHNEEPIDSDGTLIPGTWHWPAV